jgi:hypothetical protein
MKPAPIVLATAVMFAAPYAKGQPPPAGADTSSPRAAGLSETLTGSAKMANDSANLLFVNGDFAGALTKFQQAYDLAKDARLLYQMAICEKNLRHYVRMQTLLLQYLREAGESVAPENRSAIEAAIAASKSLITNLSVTTNEADATVRVDGVVVGTTPLAAATPVDLGRHTVIVMKQGFQTFEQTIETPGGNPTSITIALAPAPRSAHLVLTSAAEATVVVDDKVVGRGRFDGDLAAGAHVVQVNARGKSGYRAPIDLRDGETRMLEVTLKDEAGPGIWPWIAGGTALAIGAAVSGYFLLKNQPAPAAGPPSQLGTFMLKR